jgi:hypothetical protein
MEPCFTHVSLDWADVILVMNELKAGCGILRFEAISQKCRYPGEFLKVSIV